MADLRPLPPGSTIGILGGGQLGRMTALAAARLGYRCHAFCPEPDSPLGQVTDRATRAAYDDAAALDAFARAVDIVTFEFENIPIDTVRRLGDRVPVRPGPAALEICQDRVLEKRFVGDRGLACAPFRAVADAAAVQDALAEVGLPAVLKTARLGYDGKGQALIRTPDEVADAWAAVGQPAVPGRVAPCILEGFVDFAFEASVIAARGLDGSVIVYTPAHNIHHDHILAESRVPAPLSPEAVQAAGEVGRRLIEGLDLIGLLAVELFVTPDGGLLVNEMAPRPHNSGHWTQDACVTSQFEQLVRAICGLPLGAVDRTGDAAMSNLLGHAVGGWSEILAEPGAHLHLYGKAEAKPGRKMGHVNRVYPLGGLPPASA